MTTCHCLARALRACILGCVLGLGCASAACAAAAVQPPLQAPAILQLQAGASDEVVPQRVVALLAAVAQGDDIAALNRQVAAELKAALERARAFPAVRASTGEIYTTPRWSVVQGSSRQEGWTVGAQLHLRSDDAHALASLLGALAPRLQLQSIRWELSRAQSRQQLAALSARAIAEFRARALGAARDFGYTGYSVRRVDLGSLQIAGARPQPLSLSAVRGLAAASPEQPTPVALQPGVQQISVSVQGSVQLQP